MIGHKASTDGSDKNAGDHRAPWSRPRVIVSDLSNARANTIIPGGDGCDPNDPTYCYGS